MMGCTQAVGFGSWMLDCGQDNPGWRGLPWARWMSRYYVAPLGAVLESVNPSAVKKKVGIGYLQIVRQAQPRELVQAVFEKTKAPKRRAILARLLLLEPGQGVELVRLASEAG